MLPLLSQLVPPVVAAGGADIMQFLAAMGVGGALAWAMFQVHRKDMLEQVAKWEGQSRALMEVVTKNTTAITELTVLLRESLDHESRRTS
jgi:hypothetical protein